LAFAGAGPALTVTDVVNPGAGFSGGGSSIAYTDGSRTSTIHLPAPMQNVVLTFPIFGLNLGPGAETLTFTTPFTSFTGGAVASGGNTILTGNTADSTLTVTFVGPIQDIVFTGVAGSGGAFTQSTIAFDTIAVVAAPASTTTVKQFRNPNGTSFYENMDGSPHTVVGTIDTCSGGEGATETLVCAAGATLIRRTSASGAVTFIGSNGAAVATPAVYTIGECAASATLTIKTGYHTFTAPLTLSAVLALGAGTKMLSYTINQQTGTGLLTGDTGAGATLGVGESFTSGSENNVDSLQTTTVSFDPQGGSMRIEWNYI
jgi:hypothetical protein